MGWTSPTSFNDPDPDWTNETNAYDENTGTAAVATGQTVAGVWTGYLELNISPAISCSKIRFYTYTDNTDVIDVDLYYGGAWHDLYQGTYTDLTWEEKSIGSTQTVSKARIRFFVDADFGGWPPANGNVCEFDFWKLTAETQTLSEVFDLGYFKSFTVTFPINWDSSLIKEIATEKTENTSLSDTLMKVCAKLLTDSLTIIDVLTKTAVSVTHHTKILTELFDLGYFTSFTATFPINWEEKLTRLVIFNKTFEENSTLLDIIETAQNLLLIITEATILTDSITPIRNLYLTDLTEIIYLGRYDTFPYTFPVEFVGTGVLEIITIRNRNLSELLKLISDVFHDKSYSISTGQDVYVYYWLGTQAEADKTLLGLIREAKVSISQNLRSYSPVRKRIQRLLSGKTQVEVSFETKFIEDAFQREILETKGVSSFPYTFTFDFSPTQSWSGKLNKTYNFLFKTPHHAVVNQMKVLNAKLEQIEHTLDETGNYVFTFIGERLEA